MLSALRTAPRLQASASASRLQRLAAGPRRHYASVLDSLPKPGDRIHGFTLEKSKHVPELELSALLFKHDKTGADYLHVARDDENNVFSIGFKTNPPDATGVPHILELKREVSNRVGRRYVYRINVDGKVGTQSEIPSSRCFLVLLTTS
jgi:hypothetical protein